MILYSFGKQFAMTGFRLGAAIGPRAVVDIIVRLNVNWESCSNHFAQYGAVEALTGDDSGRMSMLETLRERRDLAAELLDSTIGVRCQTPETTFYLYPDVTDAVGMCGCSDHESFRRLVLERTGVSFCTRPQFGEPLPGEADYRLRISYSGLTSERIVEGLSTFRDFMAAVT